MMSFVTKISGDPSFEGHKPGGYTPEDARKAIAGLDGKKHSDVFFEGVDRYLAVAGGNNGFYNVFIAVNIDEELFNFIDPAKGQTDVKIVVGGQECLMPSNELATRDQAEEAARYFIETGKPSPHLQWKHIFHGEEID